MRLIRYFHRNRAIGIALAWVLAGCSTNAGFGTPVSGPNPVNNGPYGQPLGTSPEPSVSGSLPPYFSRQVLPPSPAPSASTTPTPTPAPNTISIIGAALRLAYDGSAKDPFKAPRLLELSFALENTTQNNAKVTSVVAHSDQTALGSSAVDVSAAAGETSAVASLVLKTSDDPLKYKDITLNFLDDSKKMIGSVKLDVPSLETDFTSLDEKHPKGPFSIDSVEVSNIDAGKTPHFECTFALTNASSAPVSVTAFAIKPPKGEAVNVALQVPVPARAVSGLSVSLCPTTARLCRQGPTR